MRKYFAILCAAAVMLTSCGKLESNRTADEGVLSFGSLDLTCDTEVITRASSPASGNYYIFISDKGGRTVYSGNYSEIRGGSITLPSGSYLFEARSTGEELPPSTFDGPIYGVSESFTITAGNTTSLGSLTCTLLQAMVTVDYAEDFLETVTGDGMAKVSIDPAYPLEYALHYNGGNISYNTSAGYFAVNNGENTTLNVTYSGMIDGKVQKMVANLTNVTARQWCRIKFLKKVSPQGTAVFYITINDYISDEELSVPLEVAREKTIGPDPEAPKGDGGIRIELAPDCKMFDSLDNIVVPAISTKMDLRLNVTVPSGVRKMTVEMSSTNGAFINAVALAGGTTLDLINPTPAQDIVFQIVPFPHGSGLLGKTSLLFDLSGAQEPILAFGGEHTFVLKVIDTQGCVKEVPVKLIVR